MFGFGRNARSQGTGPAGRAPDDASVIAGHDADEMRPRGFSHILLFTIASFFVVFMAWASWATLEEVTRGEGRVIPSRQTQIVQNLEGGIVEKIFVREGEVVEEDQILMRIENSRSVSDYREKRARYLALRAKSARLRAEINETAIDFPEEVLNEASEMAENELELFNRRQAELDDELDVLEQQAEQREQELVEQRSKLNQLQTSYELAREELEITEPLAKKRVVARSDYLKLRREVNDLKGGLEQTRQAIPRIESALREAHQRIEGAYSRFRSEAQREFNQTQSELAGLREVVAAGQDRVSRTEVRSPVHGTVQTVHFNTIGGVIQPGEDLIEIVPLEDTLLIEAHVRPADIAFLRPGLPAKIKVTAYDFSIYGGLDGEIEQISADTVTNDRDESFYKVRVRTEDTIRGRDGEPLPIIPGMTAEVDVITGEKTVLDYLLKPIMRAQEVAMRER